MFLLSTLNKYMLAGLSFLKPNIPSSFYDDCINCKTFLDQVKDSRQNLTSSGSKNCNINS